MKTLEGMKVAELLALPDTVLLTTAEVAAVTRVAEGTLRKWSARRNPEDLLPFTKRGGKNLYRPSDVRTWLGLDIHEDESDGRR
jgi:uncharacterized protein (DUF1800 family)